MKRMGNIPHAFDARPVRSKGQVPPVVINDQALKPEILDHREPNYPRELTSGQWPTQKKITCKRLKKRVGRLQLTLKSSPCLEESTTPSFDHDPGNPVFDFARKIADFDWDVHQAVMTMQKNALLTFCEPQDEAA